MQKFLEIHCLHLKKKRHMVRSMDITMLICLYGIRLRRNFFRGQGTAQVGAYLREDIKHPKRCKSDVVT